MNCDGGLLGEAVTKFNHDKSFNSQRLVYKLAKLFFDRIAQPDILGVKSTSIVTLVPFFSTHGRRLFASGQGVIRTS